MNYDDYDIIDNGDGTFTLTPKTLPAIDIDALKAEYQAVRDTAQALLAHRNDVNVKLQELAARRDELKAIYQNGGYGNPDAEV